MNYSPDLMNSGTWIKCGLVLRPLKRWLLMLPAGKYTEMMMNFKNLSSFRSRVQMLQDTKYLYKYIFNVTHRKTL